MVQAVQCEVREEPVELVFVAQQAQAWSVENGLKQAPHR
jgi:hypothetical protein